MTDFIQSNSDDSDPHDCWETISTNARRLCLAFGAICGVLAFIAVALHFGWLK